MATHGPVHLARHWWEFARAQWRRSLGLRVVLTSVLLGLFFITILGGLLYAQIASTMQANRVRESQVLSRALTGQAQSYWDSSTEGDVDALNRTAQTIMTQVLGLPGDDVNRNVIFTRAENNTSDVVLVDLSRGPWGISVVSDDLKQAVAQRPEQQQWQLSEVELSGRQVPAVMVGSIVKVPTAGNYAVYYVYPMEQEQSTMDLLGNAFVFAGLILLVLVGGVTWLVTRQIVTPVREAAETATRLASGHLEERVAVKGEDDIALLGNSFNQMADSLQSQIRQLESLSQVQQRFVSDVSHELRTPLTTIRMAADHIHDAREGLDPVMARSAELLSGEVDRFEELLADLLEISRFDAGAAALDTEPVDLSAVARAVVNEAEPIARRRGSPVHVTSQGETVAEVDERRIKRILRNLVVNAIEHGEGNPVEVSVAGDHQAVAVVVSDGGVGLKPGEAGLVFTRFWRGDPARARTTGGSGLGLAISLEDARLHAGWLQAWGVPGQGSRFRLTVPRHSSSTLTASPLPLEGPAVAAPETTEAGT